MGNLSFSTAYRISECYISQILKSVLKVMRTELVPILIKPASQNDFKRIEREFWEKWNTNCVGVIDGKRVNQGT